ncbi:hypothetical protein HPB49_008502 [Dermacentor silvarum]|uniref:Uncharacterized protein n=1 Tax=Dermacentor silvarum TaxID=543639 RepID=A0ACB8DX11_DERSI|nr:hypothetical protein HPB49_008502 [Dermacentor silvarum]
MDNRVASIESHLTALDTKVAVLEARQSVTEATLAHLSLPTPLIPARTPTPSGDPAIHHGKTPPHLNLWQWDSVGFCGKQSTLQFHLQNIPPDTLPPVLALQEPLTPMKLRDYTSFHPSEAHPNVATLVHRNLAAMLHQLVFLGDGFEHFFLSALGVVILLRLSGDCGNTRLYGCLDGGCQRFAYGVDGLSQFGSELISQFSFVFGSGLVHLVLYSRFEVLYRGNMLPRRRWCCGRFLLFLQLVNELLVLLLQGWFPGLSFSAPFLLTSFLLF